MTEKAPDSGRDASIGQAAASAAAALFGVQSAKNREQDFSSKSPAKFIFMGAVMTCVFITFVLIAVRCSMQQAGLAP
jgi:TRAP-type C4-dicarboxylate transport system permease small subunit